MTQRFLTATPTPTPTSTLTATITPLFPIETKTNLSTPMSLGDVANELQVLRFEISTIQNHIRTLDETSLSNSDSVEKLRNDIESASDRLTRIEDAINVDPVRSFEITSLRNDIEDLQNDLTAAREDIKQTQNQLSNAITIFVTAITAIAVAVLVELIKRISLPSKRSKSTRKST